MSGFDYAASRATADRLIAKFGMAATLRRMTSSGPAYNPTVTPADHPCTVVVIDYSLSEVQNSGGRILAKDRKVLMAVGALDIEPRPSDTLVLGGIEHRIIGPDEGSGIKVLAPGGVTVLYELQARK